MTQVLEYIMQNYTWFLVGAILILLAIIGYYADKTNFGQNKNPKNKEKEQIDESNVENQNKIAELTSEEDEKQTESLENGINFGPQTGEPIKRNDEILESISNEVMPENDLKEEKSINDLEQNSNHKNNSLVNAIESEVLSINNEVLDIEVLPEEKINPILTEEEINKFNDEFNSILPEKDFINTDLLSDIDDLELGKTQKIDLSEVPDLDDIELPKIKHLAPEEQDIWKF